MKWKRRNTLTKLHAELWLSFRGITDANVLLIVPEQIRTFQHKRKPTYWVVCEIRSHFRVDGCHASDDRTIGLMPSLQHSVAVLPLPFRRSVLPFRCAVQPFRCTLPFFRSVATVAVARENGIAGNVFPYT